MRKIVTQSLRPLRKPAYMKLDANMIDVIIYACCLMQEMVGSSSCVYCLFARATNIAMFSFNHCVISRLVNSINTLLLVGWRKNNTHSPIHIRDGQVV